MLVIRFQRAGKKNQPSFRVVLTDKRSGPQRKYLEALGFYNPRTKTVQLKAERILYWVSKGAKISSSCHNLLVSQGVISGPKIKKGKITVSSAAVRVETETGAEVAAKIGEKIEIGPKNEPEEIESARA